MKHSRLVLVVLGLALALVASACGGGGDDVPSGAVAVVDGTEVSRTELDELIERAKKAYGAQKQEFPKVGTPEYQNIQTQYVTFLVQREEFAKEADERG
ncbi:MAG: SurA N-terminal domain-containing protein, partial [Actinobacteria bacterium]|nr:SurA N-terminal domain-containing protein [Actinomycetota bacterium]